MLVLLILDINISFLTLLLDFQICSGNLVPEADYRTFRAIHLVVALPWSTEIGRMLCCVDGWMSMLAHGLAHLLCTALFSYAGFFDGKSYCLLILGWGILGFWPLGQTRQRVLSVLFYLFTFIVPIHISSFHSLLSVSPRRLFPSRMVLRKLRGLDKIILLTSEPEKFIKL